MKVSDLPIIFVENPISRFYLKVLIDKNIFNTEIIYLNNTFSIKFFEKFNFRSINHYPLKFIKNKDVAYFIDQVEDFFNLGTGFIRSAYKFNNIDNFKNISKINSKSINSKETVDFLNNHKASSYLNTDKEILKDVFKTNKSFFHIHPGYLPRVKGADGSLHSIDKFNRLGCSFFEMTRKIDDGKILKRINLEFKKLKFNNLANFSIKNIYRIWFSFFDPALRAYMYKNLIEENTNITNISLYKKFENEKSNYYSFMTEKELICVIKKIFK